MIQEIELRVAQARKECAFVDLSFVERLTVATSTLGGQLLICNTYTTDQLESFQLGFLQGYIQVHCTQVGDKGVEN
jgi:hypothetical protein